MGSAAAVLQTFQTDEWNAGLYGTLSVVSNVAINVRKRANFIAVAYSLHKVNKQMQELFNKIHGAMEGTTPPPQDAKPVTEERAKEMLHDLVRMYRSMEGLYADLRHAGLANSSISAGQLSRFHDHSEAVLDLVDWLETSLNTAEVNEIFARASEEREHGAIYDLEQVI